MPRRLTTLTILLAVALPAPFVWAQPTRDLPQQIYLRSLEHARALEVANVLVELVPVCGVLSECTASEWEAAASRIGFDERSNQLLVRTSERRMEALDALIRGIDVEAPEPELEWAEVSVEAEAVEALQFVLARMARVCGSAHPAECSTASSDSLQLVSLAIDETSNRVFALGHPSELAELRELIDLVQ